MGGGRIHTVNEFEISVSNMFSVGTATKAMTVNIFCKQHMTNTVIKNN
jgi:hypothetical protein